MARALALTTTVSLSGSYTNAQSNSTPLDPISTVISEVLTTGTAANQADRLYHARPTVSVSSTTSLDLAGSLTDTLGQAVTFVNVRGMLIRNRETTSGLEIRIGGNVNDFRSWLGATAHKVFLDAGGMLLITSPVDGYAVTAGTADVLDLVNPSASSTVSLDVFIWGTSA